MELRQYWDIIRRRLWILAALTLGALAISVIIQLQPSGEYEATTRIMFKPSPPLLNQSTPAANSTPTYPPVQQIFDVNQYPNQFLLSQYYADEVQRMVDDPGFLRMIYAKAKDLAITDKLQPDFTVKFDKTQRIFSIKVSGSDPNYVRQIANEIITEITRTDGIADRLSRQNQNGSLVVSDNTIVQAVEMPTITNQPSLAKDLLSVLLRTLLGVIAALAIIFLLAYLDNSIRRGDDIQEYLDLPVLGEIPSEREAARRLPAKSAGVDGTRAAPEARVES